MKKRMKSLNLVFGMLFVVFLIGGVSGASCNVDDDSQLIMRLYQTSNSHGALWGYAGGDYPIDLCYNDFFGTGNGDHVCSGTNTVLNLFGVGNSHAEIPTGTAYDTEVCYGDLQCISGTEVECTAFGGKIIASLYQDTNSHIGEGNVANYPVKICCRKELVAITDRYWTDMNGNPITSAEIGDTVMMIYKDAGQVYDFDIWEDDFIEDNLLLDDEIKTGISSFLKDEDAIAIWKITNDDIIKANPITEIGAYEFYFKVNGEMVSSENYLIVNKDSDEEPGANSVPTTQITAPPYEADYVIRDDGSHTTDLISFTQSSNDKDDDLRILWEFGDGGSETFENCLTGGVCDTDHDYSSSGTKSIKLTASEMTRNQKAIDESRIYVYTSGLNVFSIIDKEITSRVVKIDISRTHVSFCAYTNSECQTDYNANPHINLCKSITGELGNQIWCYDRGLRINGIDNNPNFYLGWEFDGKPGEPDVSDGLKFIKIFNDAGEHKINLMVAYDESNP